MPRPADSAEGKIASVLVFGAAMTRGQVKSDALSKATSKIDRAAFKVEREAFWKREAQQNAAAYLSSPV